MPGSWALRPGSPAQLPVIVFLCAFLLGGRAWSASNDLLDQAHTLMCAATEKETESALSPFIGNVDKSKQLPNEHSDTEQGFSLYAGTMDVVLRALTDAADRFPGVRPKVEDILLQWSFCSIVIDGELYDYVSEDNNTERVRTSYQSPYSWQGFNSVGLLTTGNDQFDFDAFVYGSEPPRFYEQTFSTLFREQCLPHPHDGRKYIDRLTYFPDRVTHGEPRETTEYPYNKDFSCTLDEDNNRLQQEEEQAKIALIERYRQEEIEAERRAAAKRKAERIAAEKRERERIAAEKRERERIAAEKRERERIAAEKRERERIAAEKRERERIAAEKRERERIAAEKRERERIAAEKRERERIAAEKRERERIAAEKRERERIAAEKLERERIAAEKLERERIAAEKLELERIAAEKLERERIAAEKLERERIAAEKLELERIAAEKLDAERIATRKPGSQQVYPEKRGTETHEELRVASSESRRETITRESGSTTYLTELESLTKQPITGLQPPRLASQKSKSAHSYPLDQPYVEQKSRPREKPAPVSATNEIPALVHPEPGREKIEVAAAIKPTVSKDSISTRITDNESSVSNKVPQQQQLTAVNAIAPGNPILQPTDQRSQPIEQSCPSTSNNTAQSDQNYLYEHLPQVTYRVLTEIPASDRSGPLNLADENPQVTDRLRQVYITNTYTEMPIGADVNSIVSKNPVTMVRTAKPDKQQESTTKKKRDFGISGAISLSNRSFEKDGFSLGISASYKPFNIDHTFIRMATKIDASDNPLTYSWGIGYDNWRKKTWALQLNHWGPLKPGDGLDIENSIASLSYKFGSKLMTKYGVGSSLSLAQKLSGDPSLTWSISWNPTSKWFVRSSFSKPLNGGRPTWAYGFGYANYSPFTWSLEYNNWGPNNILYHNFKPNGILTLTHRWKF